MSCNEFRDTLANVGVPLSDEQSKWLLNKFDCNRDGKVDYLEFTKMITAWGQADDKGGARKSTGLNWKLGSQYGSPFKQADEAREAVSGSCVCVGVPRLDEMMIFLCVAHNPLLTEKESCDGSI